MFKTTYNNADSMTIKIFGSENQIFKEFDVGRIGPSSHEGGKVLDREVGMLRI